MELNEKAKSRAQQRFFGMVRSFQKGEGVASPEVAKVADDISVKDAKKMAKTKHKGLPEKVKTEGVTYETYGYKGKKYKKLPAHVKTPAGWGTDDRGELGKAKDAITDKLGITNTKKHGVLAKEDVTLQDANGNDFLEIIDLIKPDPIKKIANKFEENNKEHFSLFLFFLIEDIKTKSVCTTTKSVKMIRSLSNKFDLVFDECVK